MRFMILVRATPDSEAGMMPDESLLASMLAYHEALAKAGVLLDANGLHPTSKGWRVQYSDGQRQVIDGPFAETKELIAGYTLIQVRSREEAMQWAMRFPQPFPGQRCEIEVRQLFELDEFEPSKEVERFRDLTAPAR
ncbi:YciI family protein [Achromobacter sp. ESBL13]|uniref:YciI family protein n=2 Tax=Pseudomonadota TaxID=1224 RepID=UPI002FC5B540